MSDLTRAPAGWAVMYYRGNDDALPEPFKALGFASNNLGAAVWLNLGTGAMVAAIPTGTWSQPAKFAFYHAAPGAAQALPLAAWTDEQEPWDGSTPNQCDQLYDKAVAYFDVTVTGGPAWSSPAWFGGEIRSATNNWGERDG